MPIIIRLIALTVGKIYGTRLLVLVVDRDLEPYKGPLYCRANKLLVCGTHCHVITIIPYIQHSLLQSSTQYAQTEEDLREQVSDLKSQLRKEDERADEAERALKKMEHDRDMLEGQL